MQIVHSKIHRPFVPVKTYTAEASEPVVSEDTPTAVSCGVVLTSPFADIK